MKKIILFSALLVLVFVSQSYPCFNPMDPFATEVVLNKPDITYDLGFIKKADNVFIDNGTFTYRSRFDSRVAAILSEVSSEIGNGDVLKGLSVKLQIPVKRDVIPYITSNTLLKGASIKNVDVPFLKSLGYSVTFLKVAKANIITLEKDKTIINVDDSPLAGEGNVAINVSVMDTESLNDQIKSDLKAIITSLGLDERVFDELETNVIKSNNETLVESVDVKKDEFDFKSAIETELDWLRENRVITGITGDDITEISEKSKAGAAGWNSRIIYEEKWLLFSNYSNGVFINRENCGGFEPVILPDGGIAIHVTGVDPRSKVATRWSEIKTSI